MGVLISKASRRRFVLRVSSAAMSFTSRSTRIARREMSSRFPRGVATTYRVDIFYVIQNIIIELYASACPDLNLVCHRDEPRWNRVNSGRTSASFPPRIKYGVNSGGNPALPNVIPAKAGIQGEWWSGFPGQAFRLKRSG